MSQPSPDRRTRQKRNLRLQIVDLPLGAHLALGSLALLLILVTFSDFGTPELLSTAYFAAIFYGALNLCHGYLREHAPAQPRRPRLGPLVSFALSTIALTAYLQVVTGTNPLALSATNATVATGLLLLLMAAFLDTITNRSHLARSRDRKMPYAGLPRWTPTWRAATLPLVVSIGVAHLGALGFIEPVTVSLTLVLLASAHVGYLAVSSAPRSPRPH